MDSAAENQLSGSQAKDVRAREGLWKDFEQLPPNPAFSTPRVRCLGCGKERSLFLPWMKTHKQMCGANTKQQTGDPCSNNSRAAPGKPRDPVWSGFDTLPASAEFSSSRICCKTCGEQHSVFLPWMRKHKDLCDRRSSDGENRSKIEGDKEEKNNKSIMEKGVPSDTEHHHSLEEPSACLINSKLATNCTSANNTARPPRRERKMPTRFADSIVEDVVLQRLSSNKEEFGWQQTVELDQTQSKVVLKKQNSISSNVPASKLSSHTGESILSNKSEIKGEISNLRPKKFQAKKRPISEIADDPDDPGYPDDPGLSIKVFAVDSPLPRELHLTVQNSATGLVEVQNHCSKHGDPGCDVENNGNVAQKHKLQNSAMGLVEVQNHFSKHGDPRCDVENNVNVAQKHNLQSQSNLQVKIENEEFNEKALSDSKQKVKIGFMCSKCCSIFSLKEDLKEHLYKCRVEKSIVNGKARSKRDFKCTKCSRQFLSKHSLNRHLQRSVCTKTRSKKNFTCPSCARRFRDNFALKSHIKACGKKTDGPRQRAVCLHASCELRFMHVKAMLDHVRQAHPDVHLDIQEFTFLNLEDFLHWKDLEEAKTMTRYVKNGVRDGGINCYRSYDCIHNGEDKNKVRLTSRVHGKGKIKTGLFCPARMQTRIMKDESVSVTYIATHTHEINLQLTQHHRLAKSTINYIKQQLVLGVHEKKIQENIRMGFIDPEVQDTNGELIKRRHIVSLIQIAKIGKKMNMQLVNSLISGDDLSSVDLLVKHLEGEVFNPIITYKAPGAPVTIGALELDHLPHAKTLFALGIQTQQQLDIMRGGDTSVLCVDSTYCKKQCDIYLISVLIPDGYGKGYPVAHFITNHQDQVTLHYMFSSLKERYPSLKVGAILTDGNKIGYNAYHGLTQVFGNTQYHLICHSYLVKLWKWRLKIAAKNERPLQIEVMAFLTAFMKEENVDFFQEMSQSFVNKYGKIINSFVNSFAKSFLSKGGQKVEQWAKCYRHMLGYSIESIPYCKDLQEKLKVYFKNQNANMRVHDLIALLLSFWNNIQVENVSEYIQANPTNEPEQVWDSEPFLKTIFQSEELKTTTSEALEDLEKLKEILIKQQKNSINSNNNQQSQVLHQTAATLKGLLQQWADVGVVAAATEAAAPMPAVSTSQHAAVHINMGNSHTNMEADTAVQNLMQNY